MNSEQWEVFQGILQAGIEIHQEIKAPNQQQADAIIGLMVRAGFVFNQVEDTHNKWEHGRFLYAKHSEHTAWTVRIEIPREDSTT